MEGVVEAEEVSFAYGESPAIDDLTLSIPAGSITALLGPNGAGKTTFVRLVTGVVRPDDGRVTVLGTAPWATDRNRLGVLPQPFDPPERLTPAELVRYYGRLYDRPTDPGATLARVGLEGVRDRQYRSLSGGERRRCCLASALVNEPDLLILDEPTGGIDPGGTRAIWALLPELVEAGTTIILATHDMREADVLADHVAVFVDGRLVSFGRTTTVIERHVGRRRLVIETNAPKRLVTDLGAGVPGDGRVVIGSVEADEVVALVEQAVHADVDVTGMHWEEPPLDELFLDIAGGEGAEP